MRCVLPHIPKLWSFLAEIAESSPGALVLIEFQRLDWIVPEHIWYQISHDHVNLFSVGNFLDRYTVLASGEFRNSEWGWVLFDPRSFRNPLSKACNHVEQIHELLRHREGMLDGAAASSRQIAIWGGWQRYRSRTYPAGGWRSRSDGHRCGSESLGSFPGNVGVQGYITRDSSSRVVARHSSACLQSKSPARHQESFRRSVAV
ncbi:MAG: hypothetical protein JW395_0829 [Nitrospira sp.]|nr:hypothetical protein [Nitrospira sp.]